jgi:hypothetical protein
MGTKAKPLACVPPAALLVEITAAAGSGGTLMQPLMYDEPKPTCGRPKNSSGERADRDHHGGP